MNYLGITPWSDSTRRYIRERVDEELFSELRSFFSNELAFIHQELMSFHYKDFYRSFNVKPFMSVWDNANEEGRDTSR